MTRTVPGCGGGAVTQIRPAAWLIAAVALFLLAVAGYALLVHAFPQYYWKQIDTATYRDGGIAVRNEPTMVAGIAGLATAILASRRGHELLGLVACAATGLLVSPISWSHHYVYVVPALVLAAYGPRRLGYRILGAALVVGLFGWWPLPIGSQGGYDPTAQLLPRGLLLLAPNEGNSRTAEFTWRGLELIVGNYYVLTLLVFLAATACALVPYLRTVRLEASLERIAGTMWSSRRPVK
jgi:hypothetical protein